MTIRSDAMFLLGSILLLALGCDPGAKTVGAGLPSDGWEEEWRASGPIGGYFLDVTATTDGVAILSQQPSGYSRLLRYSPDGEELLSVQLPGYPRELLAVGDEFVVVGSQTSTGGAHRAAVWRLSHDGEVLASYLHPRPGSSNAFGFRAAVASGEIAMIVGNWGTLAPDETQFEVVRLSTDLEALASPIQFDGWLEDVAFAPGGELLALETVEDGPDVVTKLGAVAASSSVDCQTLLAGTDPPLCANASSELRITNVDSGDVLGLGTLGFESFVRATRAHSIVFMGTVEESQTTRVVKVLDDGTVARSADLPMSAGAQHVLSVAASEAEDGAVYLVAVEQIEPSACGGADTVCVQGQLMRLAPDE